MGPLQVALNNVRRYISVDENLFYKGVDKHKVEPALLAQHDHDARPDSTLPRYVFHSGDSLLALTRKHNVRDSVLFLPSGRDLNGIIQMTIAQIVYDNERYFHSDDVIYEKVCILLSQQLAISLNLSDVAYAYLDGYG